MFIECNKYDPFWGNGLSIHNVHAEERSKWKGENALGNILVCVREGLISNRLFQFYNSIFVYYRLVMRFHAILFMSN